MLCLLPFLAKLISAVPPRLDMFSILDFVQPSGQQHWQHGGSSLGVNVGKERGAGRTLPGGEPSPG